MKACPVCGTSNNSLFRACSSCGADLGGQPDVRPAVRFSWSRRLCGAFLSLVVGMGSFVLGVAAYFIAVEPHVSLFAVLWPGVVGIVIAAPLVALPALLFVAIYLWMPIRCFLWRVPYATACGALAGVLPTFCFSFGRPFASTVLPVLSVQAAAVGAVTCLFASLTAGRFVGREAPVDQPRLTAR